jgi:AcrR family transcriptional regulator
MPRDAVKTRTRIVDAAARLFYGEGLRSVSMDAVAAKAGLTKKTLYYHFPSKDHLITAYLQSQDQPALALYQHWYDETEGDVSSKVRGMFEGFLSTADRPKWRGCGFLRTIAELASTPGHPAVKAGSAHKKRFEAWLAETLEREGVGDSHALARTLIVLLDGAATIMLIHRDGDYVRSAGDVAARLVKDSLSQSLRTA